MNKLIQARTSNIPEDLGQIQYIFRCDVIAKTAEFHAKVMVFILKLMDFILKMMCFLLELVNLQRQDGHTHAGPFLNNELFNENDELFIKNDELYIQNDVFKLIVCLRRTRWNLKKPPSARLQR